MGRLPLKPTSRGIGLQRSKKTVNRQSILEKAKLEGDVTGTIGSEDRTSLHELEGTASQGDRTEILGQLLVLTGSQDGHAEGLPPHIRKLARNPNREKQVLKEEMA